MEIPESAEFTCRIDEKPQDLDRLLLILVVAESVLVASDRDFLEHSLIAVLFVCRVAKFVPIDASPTTVLADSIEVRFSLQQKPKIKQNRAG